ncbi:MAG: hypothetical protein HEQ32_02625 [Vampirovibrio sp.]
MFSTAGVSIACPPSLARVGAYPLIPSPWDATSPAPTDAIPLPHLPPPPPLPSIASNPLPPTAGPRPLQGGMPPPPPPPQVLAPWLFQDHPFPPLATPTLSDLNMPPSPPLPPNGSPAQAPPFQGGASPAIPVPPYPPRMNLTPSNEGGGNGNSPPSPANPPPYSPAPFNGGLPPQGPPSPNASVLPTVPDLPADVRGFDDNIIRSLNIRLEDPDWMRRADAANDYFIILSGNPNLEKRPQYKPYVDAFALKILRDPSSVVHEAMLRAMQVGYYRYPNPEILNELNRLRDSAGLMGLEAQMVDDALYGIQKAQLQDAKEAQARQTPNTPLNLMLTTR